MDYNENLLVALLQLEFVVEFQSASSWSAGILPNTKYPNILI